MSPSSTGRNGRDHSASARCKVLLVRKETGELRYYLNVLEGVGCRVRACSSYEEGTRCLGDGVFDFVVVSQGTPNFEGRCVLERAVEMDRLLPVLVVTRCFNMACYLESMQLGAVDYLVEPLTVPEIVRVFDTHVRARSIAA